MVEYISPGINFLPIKKTCQPSSTDGSYLSAFTNNSEPINLSHRAIVRGPKWIKATWTTTSTFTKCLSTTTALVSMMMTKMNGDQKKSCVVDVEL
jgi:hypothetical protein